MLTGLAPEAARVLSAALLHTASARTRTVSTGRRRELGKSRENIREL